MPQDPINGSILTENEPMTAIKAMAMIGFVIFGAAITISLKYQNYYKIAWVTIDGKSNQPMFFVHPFVQVAVLFIG